MSFFGYVVVGTLVYVIGAFINVKKLKPKRTKGEHYTITHPTIISLVVGCFVIMLGVSALLGHFVLKHETMDWAFIVVNSLVATFIFYSALNPDGEMKLPD